MKGGDDGGGVIGRLGDSDRIVIDRDDVRLVEDCPGRAVRSALACDREALECLLRVPPRKGAQMVDFCGLLFFRTLGLTCALYFNPWA